MSDPNHPFNRPEFKAPKKRSKKVIIIVAGAVAVLALAGGAAYIFRDQLFGTDSGDSSEASKQPVDQAALSKTAAVASTHVANGDTATAVAVIDEAIENTSSTAQKSALYTAKATTIGSTDTPAAIVAAEQSVELTENFENTAYLAMLYERSGDNQNAIKYYERAIVLFNEIERAEENGPIDASLYQERIDRLRGQ